MHRYLFVRRYAPFKTFGLGFEGDFRDGPSTEMSADARTVGIAMFGPKGVESYTSHSTGSAWSPGAEVATRKHKRTYGDVQSKISKQKVNGNTLSFTLYTEGANPLVPGAPDIDTFVDVEITFADAIHYKGKVRGDRFPNAEIFVVERGGRAIPLFDFRTGHGRNIGPFTRLFGAGKDNELGAFDVIAPQVGPMPPAKTIQG